MVQGPKNLPEISTAFSLEMSRQTSSVKRSCLYSNSMNLHE